MHAYIIMFTHMCNVLRAADVNTQPAFRAIMSASATKQEASSCALWFLAVVEIVLAAVDHIEQE